MNIENELQIKNRGTGARGANTNAKDKTFEEETSNIIVNNDRSLYIFFIQKKKI